MASVYPHGCESCKYPKTAPCLTDLIDLGEHQGPTVSLDVCGHDKYELPQAANGKVLPIDNDLNIKIDPGQLGQITVRMVPK